MIDFSNKDKLEFDKNGYIIKNIFNKNEYFAELSDKFKNDIALIIKKNNLQNLGGYRSGNLNIHPGRYGKEILKLLNEKKFEVFFNFITGDDISQYTIQLGGNLNLPKSKNQLFHIDGPWNPRMLILNIATTQIDLFNGPMEIYEKSHIKNYSYWKFHIKKFFMKKNKIKLNYGDIIFREHRLWHRGTNNSSENYREMIGIMFLKKTSKDLPSKEISDEIKIFSNIFGVTKKEKIKEFVFLYFKPILFLYKLLISFKR
tara:strand:+ start:1824 stop:2597 length:774 start_codon:yes stop_codon:yes gene_type:complete